MHLVQPSLANLQRRVWKHRRDELPVDGERQQPKREAGLDVREHEADATVASDVARQAAAGIPDDMNGLMRALAQYRNVSSPIALNQMSATRIAHPLRLDGIDGFAERVWLELFTALEQPSEHDSAATAREQARLAGSKLVTRRRAQS